MYYISFLNDQSFHHWRKLCKSKLKSEIGFHMKYVSVTIVFIQLHVFNSYQLLFDLQRSTERFLIKSRSIDNNTTYVFKFDLLNWFVFHLR